MTKKKKIKKEEPKVIKKAVEAPPKEVKKDIIGLDSYFVIRQIKPHRRPGMLAYKEASKLEMKSLAEWDKFFASY